MRIPAGATEILLVVGMVCGLSSCAKTDAAGERPPAAEAAPIVPVVKAARADLASQLVLTAEFEPYQQVDVMAKVAGYVRSIKVDIGDRVREGRGHRSEVSAFAHALLRRARRRHESQHREDEYRDQGGDNRRQSQQRVGVGWHRHIILATIASRPHHRALASRGPHDHGMRTRYTRLIS